MAVRVEASELTPSIKLVVLSGRLDMAATEADYPVVEKALEESTAGIVVDLAKVEFVSSSGFRMLLAICEAAHAAGKTVAITRPRPSVYKIFKVAGLDSRLPFFEEQVASTENTGQ
jgi:anti-anti-sigma factor